MSRSAAFSALLLVAALPGVIAAPAAIAAPEPVPVSPEKSELWGVPHDPLADDDVSLSLSSLEEISSGASATTPVGVGEQLQAKFRIDNRSASELSDVQVTVRRADAVNSADEAQAALAHSDFPYWGDAVNLASVAPNSSTSASMDISTAPADSPLLSITQPGAYPVLFTLTGFQDGDPVHLASERLVLRVDGPTGDGVHGTEANGYTSNGTEANEFIADDTVTEDAAENSPENPERGFSIIVPVSAQIDPVPGATGDNPLIVRSEDFARQISTGGRLYELVEAYRNHDLRGAACMALDPAVVNMAARMTEGYYVNEQRPEINNEPVRLRDSWGADREPDLGDEGRGADAAREWLDMIRDVDCVLAMPWANTDLNAVQGTHDGWMLHEATDRGPELLQRVLGLESQPVLLPGNGYVSRETSYALGNLPEGAHALLADDAVASAAAAIADPATNLRASTYDGALAAILNDTGTSPVTAPYTPVEYRTGTAQASEHARDITAASMLRTVAQPAHGANTTIALLPALVEAPVAETLLSAAADVLTDPDVIPRSLDVAIGDNYIEQARAHETAAATTAETSGTASGSPYPDPSVFTDLEITQVRQQVRYINELMSIMRNDADIALTRYEYTLALRRDMLIALSHHQRNTLDGYDAAVAATAKRINANRAVLKELRESVSLAPPGNVYTRVSDASPLLVVAKNQLPLPVTTQMAFDSPEGTRLNTPEQVSIPARGSITVSMTADIPADHGRTDIRLWLATPTGSGISQPVEITVNTRSDSVILYSVAAGLTLVLATAVALRVRRRRRN